MHRRFASTLLGLVAFGLVASLGGSARAEEAVVPAPKPLVVAEPPPPAAPATPRVAVPPPPPPAPPPPRPQRWYGWQAFIVHGVADTFFTGSIAVAGASEDAAVGLLVAGLCARPLGSFVLEALHDGEYLLAPAGSFFLPAAGAAGGMGVAEALGVDDDTPAVLRLASAGAIVGGSVMAALEASFAFEDAPVKAAIGPTSVILTGRF